MYAAETNGDQVKLPAEEGISEEVAQKVKKKKFQKYDYFNIVILS